MECRNELSLHKLCAEKASIECLKVNKFKTHELCAQLLEGVQVNADSFNSNNLCAQNANINNLCVSNLKAPGFVPEVKYKAAVGLNADLLYTLGADINWDAVFNDPNSNVAVAPFSYTAPISGYYTFTFNISAHSLSGAAPIGGTPVGRLTVEKNGVLLRDEFSPFLSFSAAQSASLSSLAILAAGDVLKMHYDVLVLDPVLGLIPYVGTVVLEHGVAGAPKSGFAIHFLSAIAVQPPVTCEQCPPVVISCAHNEPGEACNTCR